MLKPYLTDYIFVARKIIPNDLCAKLISENQSRENWSEHIWSHYDTSEGKVQYSSKENELLVKQVDESDTKNLDPFISDALKHYHTEMNNNNTPFSIVSYSSPRFNRYITGSDMKPHSDCIISLFEKGMGCPILSIVGVLNDDYEGGDFIMFDNLKIELKAGDILIFPSGFQYTHHVTTVTKGERWSFVSWTV